MSMKIYSLTIMLALSLVLVPAQSKKSPESTDIPIIAFCELVQNPAVYNGREVRFRARYIASHEVAAFGDPNCTTRENRTWAEFDGISIKAESKPEIFKKLEEQILCGKCGEDKEWRETEMLVTAVFNAEDTGHGFLGEYRFMVTVKNIEEISETAKTEMPWFMPQ